MEAVRRKLKGMKSNSNVGAALPIDNNWSPLRPDCRPTARILLYTDPAGGCSRSSKRRLAFDSDSLRRDDTVRQGEKYDEIANGAGYKYLHPRQPDAEQISEMVFGTVDLAEKSSGYKVHPMRVGLTTVMWSKIFYGRRIDRRKRPSGSRNPSEHSFTMSSQGSSISCQFASSPSNSSQGTTSCSPSFDYFLPVPPAASNVNAGGAHQHHPHHQQQQQQQQPAVMNNVGFQNDSGIYSVPSAEAAGSDSHRVVSGARHGADHNAGLWHKSVPAKDRSASPLSQSQLPPPPLVKTPPSEESGVPRQATAVGTSRINSADLSAGGRLASSGSSDVYLHPPSPYPARRAHSGRLMGLALVINAPEDDMRFLFENAPFVEDVLNRLKTRCLLAYFGGGVATGGDKTQHKFLHLMHGAWAETQNNLQQFFVASRLRVTAWMAVGRGSGEGGVGEHQERFLREFIAVRQRLDRKDNQLFFSTFLSAFLSCHLGWAATVPCMAPDVDMGAKNFARCDNVEKFQYYQLHGMIGNPCKPFKSVLVGEDRALLQRLIFVLSYFLRCSDIIKRRASKIPRVFDLAASKRVPVRDNDGGVGGGVDFDMDLEDGDKDEEDEEEDDMEEEEDAEEVNFTIGDNESLVSAETLERRRSMRRAKGGGGDDDGSGSTTGIETGGDPADNEEEVKVFDLVMALPASEVTTIQTTRADDLPTIMCLSEGGGIVPGAVLQGCCVKKSDDRRADLQRCFDVDLRSSLENSWISRTGCADYRGLAGDIDTGAVHIHSTLSSPHKDPVPFYPVPLVLDLVDAVEGLFSISSRAALQLLENKLSDIVNRSVVLAKYLMNEDFVNKEKLIKDLGWHFNDIELLLPVSSIHTPSIGEKYSIGFL